MKSNQWWDKSWNVVTGCSNGCEYCWARKMAKRLWGMRLKKYRNGFYPTFHPEELDNPLLRSKKPKIIAVSLMGDLFDKKIDEQAIIFSIYPEMENCPQHKFVIITRQIERLYSLFYGELGSYYWNEDKPIPNIFHLLTITTQKEADEKIPILLRFKKESDWEVGLSIEPILEEIDISKYIKYLDWVILGWQRPFPYKSPDNFMTLMSAGFDIISLCNDNNIPIFTKNVPIQEKSDSFSCMPEKGILEMKSSLKYLEFSKD